MGTQVLKGSTGVYQPRSMSKENFGNCNFTVTKDTCLEAWRVPIRFEDSTEVYWIPISYVDKWVNKLTRDY